ncbi:bifunctional 3-(3-hydroxy-phenyl)propionate/3-hydroxycinnamic acid hydroxylase [Telluria aromaticivorans]|uniref:Bifunctional 3-(3-hydroxy-phenyl)propionate/3-hydroxycinnamic acid hydroxylase n=1 Tax=Telluria aromaticivorans TaxID=2725995 RepID=A0A7Y2K049_9BURK|nr:bifunctional 3-(3-hydroxy-phenyl)propionate/3-hydroxycinnamic acid hydroxylase [Telluria aromaticivorans]
MTTIKEETPVDTFIPQQVDVLLVGLGPVGAAAANLLGRHGVRTLAIDKAKEIYTAPRAIVLDNEALRILQMAGLEDGAFATLAVPKVEMHSPLFGNYARAYTAGHVDCHPRLVTFFQPELERVLRERLARHACVDTALGVELTGFEEHAGGVRATLLLEDGRTQQVEARYLVGADGAHSRVRRLAGIAFDGKTFSQDWLVVDAVDVPVPIDHVEFICDPRRPSPHMAAPGNRQRWEFMLHPGETHEQMERPEQIRRLLAPWCDADRATIERTAVYRFHARIVDRFSAGRVFLAGDAAHITPPFVGQGLVAGLRDVANLCWKLAWVVQDRAAPAILDSYDAERRPHAKSIIQMALWMGRLVMPRNRLAAFGVHGLMALLQAIPFTRSYFQDLKFTPPNRFRRGLFRPGRGGSRLVRGAPLPQGLVRRSVDTPCVPSDDVFGQALALVGFGCDPALQLSPGLSAQWEAAGGRILHLRHRGQPGDVARSWEDMTDALVPDAAPVGWVAVLRPDRTVMHDGPLDQLDRLVSEALTLLGGPDPAARPAAARAEAGPQLAA